MILSRLGHHLDTPRDGRRGADGVERVPRTRAGCQASLGARARLLGHVQALSKVRGVPH